ncbi:unnamed protein product [Mytilus coruscus]|uniref:Uncharacterized protein n=1 Tax=Mytilus coruscus TaxID=42192 RepID=A0A6J8APU7_MYTCO|nr:unnamed protein product [Mytilus coruscus]
MKQMLSHQIPKMKRKSARRSPEPCVRLKINPVAHILTRQILDQLLLKLLLILIMSISISIRTRRPFESAAGGVSSPSTTCAMPVNNLVTGGRTVHFSNANCSTSAIHNRTINNEQLVNDKYLYLFSDFDSDYCLNHDIEILHRQVRFFENFKSNTGIFSGVKGRLAKSIQYWEHISANSFILDTLKKGYLIPFIDSPSSMYMKNNKSALQNNEFVSKSVNELVLSGCVIEVPFQPYIVNPLSVATQKSGKGVLF